MTACLILEMNKVNVSQLNSKTGEAHDEDIKQLVDKLATTASKVQGSAGLDGFYLDETKRILMLLILQKRFQFQIIFLMKLGSAKVKTVWQRELNGLQKLRSLMMVLKDELKNYNSSDIIM